MEKLGKFISKYQPIIYVITIIGTAVFIWVNLNNAVTNTIGDVSNLQGRTEKLESFKSETEITLGKLNTNVENILSILKGEYK